MDEQVRDYLISERQWTRQCRIDHARLLFAKVEAMPDSVTHAEVKRFWHEVIFRLTGSER